MPFPFVLLVSAVDQKRLSGALAGDLLPASDRSEELAGHRFSRFYLDRVQKMENGKRPVGKANARKLAEALNVDYRMFL